MTKFLAALLFFAPSLALAGGHFKGLSLAILNSSSPVAAAAGGGGSGTTILGTDSQGGTTLTGNANTFYNGLAFTASANATPATCEIYANSVFGTEEAKCAIFDNAGTTKICETASTVISDTLGWQSLTFSGCSALSNGTNYHVGFMANGTIESKWAGNDAFDQYQTAVTFPTVPASINVGTTGNGESSFRHPMSIRVKN